MKITVAAGITAVVVSGLIGFTSVASAEPTAKSTTRVDGFEGLKDDFADHYRELGGPLCESGCVNGESDVVVLWKSILASDGYLDGASVEGEFDFDTTVATKFWQEDRGLKKTGEVDEATWERADDKLVWEDEAKSEIFYDGSGKGKVHFIRDADDGEYHYRYYTSEDGYQMWNEMRDAAMELSSVTISLARG